MAFSKEKAHERAEKYAAKGQHEKAAREYQSIVDHDPKDVRAWLMLADCLARTGDRGGAVGRYLQVADFYAGNKEQQKALAVYRQVLNIDPNRLDIHYKCATINVEIGRVHDAIASFEQIAQAQLSAGHTSEALKTYLVIADADPSIVSKRLRLAELYSRERMVDEAVDAFRAAGDVLLSSGRKADFVRVAERLIYHKNDDRPTIRQLARVYLELGDARRALMKLNALLQADQTDREGLELLAETFIALGKPDKATSVIAELARKLMEMGESGVAEARRVLSRGLEWEPTDGDLLRLRNDVEGGGQAAAPVAAAPVAAAPVAAAPTPAAPEPEAELDDGEPIELDVDDSDVLELDEDDVILEDTGVRAAPSESDAIPQELPASITDEVMSEVVPGQHEQVPGPGADDFDKILFEARVYIKYRLFDHSLDHIQSLLDQQPEHVGALGLRARALTELGQAQDAADTHVRVAQLVMGHDPKLALEHVAAAVQVCPEHMGAAALQAELDSGAPSGPAPAASAGSRTKHDEESGISFVGGAGDSGAFSLDDDDGSGAIATGAADSMAAAALLADAGAGGADAVAGGADDSPLDSGTDFSIEFSDADDEPDVEATAQREVENRFGLSDAAPLPSELLDEESDVISTTTESTPPSGFVPRPPVDVDEPPPAPPGGDHPTGRFRPTSDDAADLLASDGSSAGAANEGQAANEDRAANQGAAANVAPEPTALPQDLDAGFDELMSDEESGAVIVKPGADWADLSDDLAEIRFFVDQGLDEDAEAALDDLAEQHPGHPDLAALRAELNKASQPEPAFESGAKPLVDMVTEEDEEADAYLSTIFGGGATASKRKRKVEVTAVAAEGESANARDHFDLGMAYREMGLVDGAITEFEAAAADPSWKSRALVMVGTLQVHRGETDVAVSVLGRAVDAANTDDERHEAKYELGLLFEKLGQRAAAIEQLQAVAQGFRDRDEKLVALQG